MVAGIILVLAGILIAIFPQLLSLIVAGVLIYLGATVLAIGWFYRKKRAHFENPAVEFFFRY